VAPGARFTVTGPHGGKTTVTPGGLRRVNLSLDQQTLRRLDYEVELLQKAGRQTASRSDVVRQLAKSLRKPG
jgi:hypothetical protein